MRTPDWKAALNVAANAAIIAASAAVVLAVWVNLRGPHRAASGADPQVSSLRAGGKAPVIAGVDYARSERTLAVFMSVHCGYCREAAPFFRDLAASLAPAPGKPVKARVLAVFPEDAAEVDRFEDHEDFHVETASGLPLQSIGVSGTPAVVLVSRDGRVF